MREILYCIDAAKLNPTCRISIIKMKKKSPYSVQSPIYGGCDKKFRPGWTRERDQRRSGRVPPSPT